MWGVGGGCNGFLMMNNGCGGACGCVCVWVCKSGIILGTFGQNVVEVHFAGRGGFQCWNPYLGGGFQQNGPWNPPFWLLEGGVPVTNLVTGTPFMEVPRGSSHQITKMSPPQKPPSRGAPDPKFGILYFGTYRITGTMLLGH